MTTTPPEEPHRVSDADSFRVDDSEPPRVARRWGSEELTLAGILYAAVVAIPGVVVPMRGSRGAWIWAGGMVVLGALLLLLKEPVIRLVDRYLGWGDRGRKIH
jgi:hypothetical protein